MTPEADGLPMVARSARALGVRVNVAFQDVQPDQEGRIAPGTGGMSAPLSEWNLPNHRRPFGMGRGSTGPREDHVFAVEEDSVGRAALVVRSDPSRPTKHAFVEPAELVELPLYEMNLASTRGNWVRVWP